MCRRASLPLNPHGFQNAAWTISTPLQFHTAHGEGRFVARKEMLESLIQNGQVAFQYVDAALCPSMDISANPNGSMYAVEGITSPDGRVLGKMGHTERRGDFIAKNIPGEKYQPLFEGGIFYFK